MVISFSAQDWQTIVRSSVLGEVVGIPAIVDSGTYGIDFPQKSKPLLSGNISMQLDVAKARAILQKNLKTLGQQDRHTPLCDRPIINMLHQALRREKVIGFND